MQNAFFKLFWFDFDRTFWADREKRPLARSFVVERILNLFFRFPQAFQFKVVSYFSFHRCPIVREIWPHSPYSRTLRRVAQPRWRLYNRYLTVWDRGTRTWRSADVWVLHPVSRNFECPYQHPPWCPVSIGKPAPKIHQWTIYFCRWGFGWVDKAQCFRSARRFGAVGSSPDFSRVFHDIWLRRFGAVGSSSDFSRVFHDIWLVGI